MNAERAPHHALPAVAAGEVGAAPGFTLAVALAHGVERDAVAIVGEIFHPPAEPHHDVRPRARMLEQKFFDIHLVGAMQRFGYLIGLGRGGDRPQLFGRRRHRQARQLPAAEAREIDHVGRMIGGQAQRAHVAGDAEPAKMLHRPRALRASFRMPARRFLGVEQHRAHAVPIEQKCEHQPDRPAADNCNWCVCDLRVSHDQCTPPPFSLMIAAQILFRRLCLHQRAMSLMGH